MDTTIIATGSGRLRGRVDGGVHSFRGIPYAAPPFGANRLRPPRPAESWSGVRDALSFGAEPPQLKPPPDHPASAMVWDPAEPGEDCLNLNIWTPDPEAHGLPVMVWIPGGMFEVGTGATYDGSRFARDGVVCVTINYRVGPEGFLYLADGDANLGLLDQVAALEWVRANIEAFGGDPANVTIFGESAGAMSVGTLLAVPRAEGLFRRAICQSGAADRVIDAATALRIGRELAARLGIEATRDAFAAVPPDRLLLAAAELKGDLLAQPDPGLWGLEVIASMLPWQPVIDGDVLPAAPIERIAAGSAAGVDVMAGSNTDDWKLFVIANGSLGRVTVETLTGPVATHGFETALAYGLSDKDVAGYRAAYPGAVPGEILAAIETDWWCRIPALRLAEAHAPARSGTFMYEFAWAAPGVGACHALEIGFVFDTLDLGPNQMLGPMLGGAPHALADAMHCAWVAFAMTGEPGWTRYDPVRRATMRFDTVNRVVEDPRAFERGLWDTAGSVLEVGRVPDE
jgi:para-nitrobenzyl esterase